MENRIARYILIWEKEIGFIRINEGTGENLWPEDEDQGYVDYIMLDFMEYDGLSLEVSDGEQVLMTELYQEKFNSVKEVIEFLIEEEYIPKAEYTILYGDDDN
jgi:hypothetical protein